MPLAEAPALSFTMPLFMLGLAVLTLREPVGWRRLSAAVVGFAGVLIMLRRGAVPVELAALMALLGAFFHACSGVFIKKLVVSESTGMIMFYFAFIGTLVFAVPAAGVWVAPDAQGWVLLVAVTVLGVASQLTFIAAARAAEMSAIVPLDYSRLASTTLQRAWGACSRKRFRSSGPRSAGQSSSASRSTRTAPSLPALRTAKVTVRRNSSRLFTKRSRLTRIGGRISGSASGLRRPAIRRSRAGRACTSPWPSTSGTIRFNESALAEEIRLLPARPACEQRDIGRQLIDAQHLARRIEALP